MPLFAMFNRPEGCRSTPERVGKDHTNTSGKGGLRNDGNHDAIARPPVRGDETDRVRQKHRAEVAGGRKAREASAGCGRAEVPDAARWSTSHLLDHRDPVRLRRVHPARVFARSAAGRIGEPALDHKARRIERPGLRARPLFSGETTIVRASPLSRPGYFRADSPLCFLELDEGRGRRALSCASGSGMTPEPRVLGQASAPRAVWAGSGKCATRVVPPPDGLSSLIVPPNASILSFSPARPEPRAGSAPPTPSSRMQTRRWPSRGSTVTSMRDASACFVVFVSVSATT